LAKKAKKNLDDITKKFGDEREKALNDALKVIEKDFGKGALMRLGDKAEQKVQVMSSGSLALDIALGVGGYPKGRIIEIYGPESSGKTTVALHAVAQAQKKVALQPLLMRNTRLTLLMQQRLVSTLMNSYFLNQTLVSKVLKLLVN
jgi:protein RecA